MVRAMPTVEVKGTQILLNGEPVVLRGFGRHEYFPITGRGFVPTMIMDALNK
jgi:beta-glucuronidase